MPTRLGVREDAHVGHTRREFDRAAYCQRNSDLPKDQGLPTSARAVAGGVWRSAGRFGAGGLQMGAGSVLSRHYLFADAGTPVGVPDRRSVWVREFDALRAKKEGGELLRLLVLFCCKTKTAGGSKKLSLCTVPAAAEAPLCKGSCHRR